MRISLLKWFLVLLPLSLLVTGCSGVKEINRITFVTALGVDKSEQGVTVYALVAVPGRFSSLSPGGAAGGPQTPDYILTAKGVNIADALYKMKRKTARDIQFGHTKVVLFSEQLAKQGLNEHIDLLMRREEFQMLMWIGVTRESTKKVLSVTPEVPESVGDLFVDVFSQSGSDTFEILPIYLFQFYSFTHEPGQSPYAMVIEPTKEGNRLEMTDLALFKNDKFVNYIPPSMTKFVQMLQGKKLLSTTFTMTNSVQSFVLLKYRRDIKWNNDQMNVNVKVKLSIDQSAHQHIQTALELKDLERKINLKMENQIEQLISKLQTLHTDPVGFGEKYRLAHGGTLDNNQWLENTFPHMKFDVRVQSEIERKGMVQ